MDGGQLVGMHVQRASDGLQPGARVGARLVGPGVAEVDGETIRLDRVPAGAAGGALVQVEIVRAAIAERHRVKPARGIVRGPATTGGILLPAPPLAEALKAKGMRVRHEWPDPVAAQWADALEAAELGELRLGCGRLSFVPTPAGVAVDVDGAGPRLALDAAAAIARVIRLWGLGGSVMVDFPPLDRAGRAAAAAALDQALAGQPFERTAINGFGLMQIVLPRRGPSILERCWFARGEALALDLLEAAERAAGTGPLRIHAPPSVADFLGRNPGLVAAAARRCGRRIDVKVLPGAGAGHVAPA